MYCYQCGTESQAQAQFCRSCGANFKTLLKGNEIPRPLIQLGSKKTPAERREKHLTTGIVSIFSGIGLTIFLYFLSAALVLRLPPHIIEQIPFEIGPVVRIIWLVGLLPTLSGVGHILAGLMIRPRQNLELDQPVAPPRDLTEGASTTTAVPAPGSVTERTTNLFEHNY
ncbi:MAG TPA: hypothetical protein VFD62_06060 [Pyrinomonadaceae bacterium]|nr:hypothetical protein [Pyrinomonadaceae bacterium]